MQENGNDILILFIVSSLLIAVILVLAFTFLLSYQKKMVAQKLQIQEVKVDLQQKLLNATIDAQEKERKRVAADLHDEVGSLLSALQLNVKHLKTVDKIGEVERAFLDTTTKMLDDGLTSVRNVSYNLLPPTLVRFGLWEALKELIKRVHNSNQIHVTANFSDVENVKLNAKSELSVFRVIQELISNTTHHSGATEITIICRHTTQLEIEYKDNGSGITDQSQLQGLGMINMQSRIQAINGKLSISDPGTSSFSAVIDIPLAQSI